MAKKKKARAKAKTKPKTKAKAKTKPKAKAAKSKAASKPKKKTVKASKAGAAALTRLTALPDMAVETTNGGRMKLSELKGKNVVLYFYPKDDTPGCTTEGCDIRDRYSEFQRTDTVVLGVSRDRLDSHEEFKAKFGFPFELVSDPEEKLCRAFDVMRKKSLYGKEYIGVDRSTFVFDKSGKLRKEFRGVQVAGHAEELLKELNNF